MSLMIHAALEPEREIETPFPDSPWVVLKFGGRSVATAENWGHIATILRARVEEGVTPVVCHSALAGVSNALIALIEVAERRGDTKSALAAIVRQHDELAAALGVDPKVTAESFADCEQLISSVRLVGEASPRIHARVLATGELAATRLGAAYLERIGFDVEWLDARELLRSTSGADVSERAAFMSARCEFDADRALQARLKDSRGVIVTQGFIARNSRGDTVLLGRGGSDTSGSYLASKLEARRLEIWTDVPGFFSADPKAVPSARLIRSLHYQEAQEIASAGGGILHPRSISPVRSTGIPLFLRSTLQPDLRGTIISDAIAADAPQLKAISSRSGITLISMDSLEMWHQVGFLADVFGCFRRRGISVDLISTSESNVTVSIDRIQNVVDADVITALVNDLGKYCRVGVIEDCAAITLIGRRIRAILHELGSVFETFEEQKIHLLTQAATDLNLTFVVNAEHAHKLVQRLHGLLVHRFRGGVFGQTFEQISGAEPQPPAARPATTWWMDKADELIALGEEHGAAYVYDRATIESALDSLSALRSIDTVFYSMKANNFPEILRIVEARGAGFECVSPGEIRRLLQLFPNIERNRILFTPNFAGREEYEWGLEQDVWLTLDNLYILREWGDSFRGRDVFLRIDTGQGRGHHEHVRTAGVHSKFGIPLFELDEVADLVRRHDGRVVGLHAHTGSGVLDPATWRPTAECLLDLTDRFPDVRYIDIGGGLGVPEKPGQVPLDLSALDAGLAELRAEVGDRELWLEPGRFIVAQAGVLLAQVTQTKGKGDVQYLGVRTGMNSLIRPALYGAYHDIVNLSRLDQAATEIMTVVGPICETGDRLGSDRLLPEAEEGDVILIANAGAYGQVMSSEYNLRERIPELVI
ncbi:MAG TPA: bifunctional aspartate kinase/diaminopimelate decarboxylase [Gammaproteobacteria bacterium]|nr:bifunctional aspartate kinase/diaminopimelate decarboxylase [Gammaproteobacteria bacterium]